MPHSGRLLKSIGLKKLFNIIYISKNTELKLKVKINFIILEPVYVLSVDRLYSIRVEGKASIGNEVGSKTLFSMTADASRPFRRIEG